MKREGKNEHLLLFRHENMRLLFFLFLSSLQVSNQKKSNNGKNLVLLTDKKHNPQTKKNTHTHTHITEERKKVTIITTAATTTTKKDAQEDRYERHRARGVFAVDDVRRCTETTQEVQEKNQGAHRDCSHSCRRDNEHKRGAQTKAQDQTGEANVTEVATPFRARAKAEAETAAAAPSAAGAQFL